MKTTDQKLIRTLRIENLIYNLSRYLRLLLPALIPAGAACFCLRYAGNGLVGYYGTTACVVLLVASFIVFAVTRSFWRETIQESACRIDAQFHSFNRMEACLELREANHPLRETQEEEATKFFETCNFHPKKRFFFTYLALAIFAAVFGIWQIAEYGTFTLTQEMKDLFAQQEQQKKKENTTRSEKDTWNTLPAKEAPDQGTFFAKLEIDSPEEEMPAKPFDLIEWTGSATASGELKNLRMTVYLNGEKKCEIPVGTEFIIKNKDHSLALSGELDLEELGPVIHDLAAYHLSAEIQSPGAGEVTVMSEIHFIEVKPFREEIGTENKKGTDNGGQNSEELPELIKKIMVQQIAVNKATFTLRMAEVHPNSDIKLKQETLLALRKSQDEIKKESVDLLAAPSARMLPGNTVNQLELAVENMENACRTIETLFRDSKSK